MTPLDSWDKKQELRKGLIFKSKIEIQYALKVYSSNCNQEYKVKESNKTNYMYVAIMGVHGECEHVCVVHMDFGRLQNTMVPTL